MTHSPIPCRTGAVHEQPTHVEARIECLCAFSADYNTYVDLRGALDAPHWIPRGGVRALDIRGDCLLVAEVERAA